MCGFGVMGSDGFESKKLGGPAPGGAGQNRLGPVEYAGRPSPDVLLHVTVLRRDGYQTAYEGARLVVECVQRAKGYQAFRILSMDESTAIHPAQMLPPRTHVSVTPTSGLERAQVKWFNRLRGFGFLTCGEGTPDIFVHMETLRRFGMTELRPGQYVLVRFGPGSKGMMAAEIHPETGPSALSSH